VSSVEGSGIDVVASNFLPGTAACSDVDGRAWPLAPAGLEESTSASCLQRPELMTKGSGAVLLSPFSA
jgi:hypothetical protein